MKVAILCASTRSAAALRDDVSTTVLRELVENEGWQVIETSLLPDEQEEIRSWLIRACDELHADLVLTTGGTGLNPTDVTPEATLSVIERLVPGIPEAMRSLTLAITPYAMLSRGVAGIRRSSLIVNLPGSPKAVKECFDAVKQVLPHAIDAVHARETHPAPQAPHHASLVPPNARSGDDLRGQQRKVSKP